MLFEGKTVEEAIQKGLSELGIEQNDADIKVIEQPVKGLFGRVKTPATVSVEKKEILVEEVVPLAQEVAAEKTAEFIEKLIKLLEIDANVEVKTENDNTIITLVAQDSSSVIGYRGEVLDAIQTLAGAMENTGRKVYKKVVVDCENYRDKREETLIKLAQKLEKKATEMKREVILEPMCPYERRVIHTALAESQTVTTRSDGKEPNRYVVIVPNDKDEFSKPYNAGRNKGGRDERRDNRRGKKGGFKGGKRDRAPRSEASSKKSKTITFGTYLGNRKDL